MRLAGSTITPGTGHEAGRALLARLYRQETGEPLPAIVTEPGGKPRFADSPWEFSISHTRHHVFCVLSGSPVGIDAEELQRRVDPRLAGRILSPSELAQYHAAGDKNKALLTFWVLKEAQAKCTGEGLSYPPKPTAFSLEDPRVQIIDGCLVAVIEEEPYAV